jgi:hypothetical protein
LYHPLLPVDDALTSADFDEIESDQNQATGFSPSFVQRCLFQVTPSTLPALDFQPRTCAHTKYAHAHAHATAQLATLRLSPGNYNANVLEKALFSKGSEDS